MKVLSDIKEIRYDCVNKFFKNISDEKLHLNVGCGSGEVLCKLAELYPKDKFIGVEIRRTSAEMAAGRIEAKNILNAFVFHCDINYLLAAEIIQPNTFDYINIFFPTPSGIEIGGRFIKNINNWDFINGIGVVIKKYGSLKIITDHLGLFREFKSFIYSKDWREIDFENPYLDENKDFILGSPYEYQYVYLGYEINKAQFKKL